MPPDAVNQIEVVAAGLRPDTPELLHRRLFVQHDFELMDEKGDFERQRKELDAKRQSAVAEILKTPGITGGLAFAESVPAPSQVGEALSAVAAEDVDHVLLPEQLRSDKTWARQFVGGFIWRRFWKNKWPWVDEVIDASWTFSEK